MKTNTIVIHMIHGINLLPPQLKKLQRDIMDLVPLPKRSSYSLQSYQGYIKEESGYLGLQSLESVENPIRIEKIHGTDQLSFARVLEEEGDFI